MIEELTNVKFRVSINYFGLKKMSKNVGKHSNPTDLSGPVSSGNKGFVGSELLDDDQTIKLKIGNYYSIPSRLIVSNSNPITLIGEDLQNRLSLVGISKKYPSLTPEDIAFLFYEIGKYNKFGDDVLIQYMRI